MPDSATRETSRRALVGNGCGKLHHHIVGSSLDGLAGGGERVSIRGRAYYSIDAANVLPQSSVFIGSPPNRQADQQVAADALYWRPAPRTAERQET